MRPLGTHSVAREHPLQHRMKPRERREVVVLTPLDEVKLDVLAQLGQSLRVRHRDEGVAVAVNEVDRVGLTLDVLVVHERVTHER